MAMDQLGVEEIIGFLKRLACRGFLHGRLPFLKGDLFVSHVSAEDRCSFCE
jgi:hypothetical protein